MVGLQVFRNFPAKSETDLADLDEILHGKSQVYLVDYLVEISDPQRLVAKKLESLGFIKTETKNFNGVGFVYGYSR